MRGVVLCIENKIWSDVHNDLKDYREHCERVFADRTVLGVVLGPRRVDDAKLGRNRFVAVTYGDIIDQLRERLGEHVGPHNTRYQYLLFDFIEQAARLSRTSTMNEANREFLCFWKRNENWLSEMEARIDHLRGLLDPKEHCRRCLEELGEPTVFRDWTHNKTTAVFDLANGTVDGCRVFLDVEFHPLRVKHVLGGRRAKKPDQLAVDIEQRGDVPDALRKALPFHEVLYGRDRRRVLVTEASPLEAGVATKAVEMSVAILRHIAERHAPANV